MKRLSPAGVAKLFQFGTRDLAWAFVVASLALAYYFPHREGPADTGRELDLAILGKGYFRVKHEFNGLVGYTRNGRFSLNGHGQFVVGRPVDGWLVDPQITLPSDHQEVFISHDGVVSYRQPGSEWPQQAGQLQLCNFIAPEHLLELAPGILRVTNDSGLPQIVNPGQHGTGLVQQGRLESPPLLSRLDWPDLWSWAVVGLAIFAIREVRKLREEVRRSRDASLQLLSTRCVDSMPAARDDAMPSALTTVAASADDR